MCFVSVMDAMSDSGIHIKVLPSGYSFTHGPLMWSWTNSIRVGGSGRMLETGLLAL